MAETRDTEIRHHFDLPDDVVPLSVVEVVEYLDEHGERAYGVRHAGSGAVSGVVGLLELAKRKVLSQATFHDD